MILAEGDEFLQQISMMNLYLYVHIYLFLFKYIFIFGVGLYPAVLRAYFLAFC